MDDAQFQFNPNQIIASPPSGAGPASGRNGSPTNNGKSRSTPSKALCISDFQQGAEVVKDATAMGVLSIVAAKMFKDSIPASSYQLYRNDLLHNSGKPTDPIEVMLIEQLMWAHHAIGNLHVLTASATTAEETNTYSACTTNLMGEFRRTSLALKEYRGPTIPQNLTLVGQQNLAAGNQHVALVQQGVRSSPEEKAGGNIELGSNDSRLTHDTTTDFDATSTCRPAEPLKTQGINGRRSFGPASRSVGESALDGFNRAENSDG